MSEEKVGYRWWVLAMSALIFTIAFGLGWTYIVLVVGKETGPRVRQAE